MDDRLENLVTSTKTSEKLKEDNIHFFEENYPGIAKAVNGAQDSLSKLSFVEGELDNLLVDGTPLYGGDAQSYCEKQLKEFWAKPEQIIFEGTASYNASPVSKGMMEALNDEFFHPKKGLETSNKPVTDQGYCFVFGFGLGLFLSELIEKKVARNIVIIEPMNDFFFQSMNVLDWRELYEKADENQITIHYCFHKEPEVIVEYLETIVRKVGNTFLDGSSFFMHYPSWEIMEAYKLFRERLKVYFQSSGFYEDELIMCKNTYLNLITAKFRIVRRKPFLHQDYPVVVVASGPSFEFDLENLKKIRDQVIVVSSGTTINLLLKNGIRPDFHAELENVEKTHEWLSMAKEKYGFHGISLLASMSVFKGVAGLFDESYLFMRSGSSAATLFDNGTVGEINEITPMSANAAIAGIASLGFRNFYLIGVDCGKYEGANHHAKGTIYDEIGLDMDHHNEFFNIKVPGNFGGTVRTSKFLNISRRNITGLTRRLGLNVYNCSHGARIDGTKPQAAATIQLKNKPGQQELVKQSIRNQAREYQPAEYFDELQFDKTVLKVDILEKSLKDFIAKAKGSCTSIYDFEQAFEKEYWDANLDKCKGVMGIAAGSQSTMIRLASYGGARIVDEEERNNFIQLFIGVFERQSLWMFEQIRGFLGEMLTHNLELSEPEEYQLKKTTED
ncbi:6-hydroxymethylpterin diphosphokinase MptE-like protein [Terasakiella sp. SH-1]|uniref:motility associated factor glycosyltransferase family protein n=1 Tax=Terasakiella sp. SH-1 TaxID=2560057 RepID=UPI001073629D|nr:6-hydroxymethylpterin diphosphokinase MptE-like protein [Terasakiella sp. SH-1]